jgi:hypothetical protein
MGSKKKEASSSTSRSFRRSDEWEEAAKESWKVLESFDKLLPERNSFEKTDRSSFRAARQVAVFSQNAWPALLTIGQVVAMLHERHSGSSTKILQLLIDDCGDGYLNSEHADILSFTNGSHFVKLHEGEEKVDASSLKNSYRVGPVALKQYLSKKGFEPSEHLAAWFIAAGIGDQSIEAINVSDTNLPQQTNPAIRKKRDVKVRREHNLKVWNESNLKVIRGSKGPRFPNGTTALAKTKGWGAYEGETAKRDLFVSDLEASGVVAK